LEKELNLTDEDPLLVIRMNPNFQQGNINVNAVCDAIATYNTPGGVRRDSGRGCHRWIFHFDHSPEILDCRDAILQQFRSAFVQSAASIAESIAHGARGLPTEPMATAVIITKIAVRQDEVLEFPFFYL
jgi:hypothetical protein